METPHPCGVSLNDVNKPSPLHLLPYFMRFRIKIPPVKTW